jgi:hypothetical protein
VKKKKNRRAYDEVQDAETLGLDAIAFLKILHRLALTRAFRNGMGSDSVGSASVAGKFIYRVPCASK